MITLGVIHNHDSQLYGKFSHVNMKRLKLPLEIFCLMFVLPQSLPSSVGTSGRASL